MKISVRILDMTYYRTRTFISLNKEEDKKELSFLHLPYKVRAKYCLVNPFHTHFSFYYNQYTPLAYLHALYCQSWLQLVALEQRRGCCTNSPNTNRHRIAGTSYDSANSVVAWRRSNPFSGCPKRNTVSGR